MYEYIIGSILKSSNYSYMNKNNIFNFIINVYDILNDNQKIKLKEYIKINIGMSFYKDLELYYFQKLGESF